MTSIDPRQRLTALLRSEVAAFQERAGTQGARRTQGADNSTPRPDAGAGAGAGAVAMLLAQRVGAISPDDPQRRQKAFRAFLETTLLNELGEGLIRDPHFSHMVDAVHAHMQDDAQLAVAAEEVAGYLLSQGSAGAGSRK